MLSTITTVVLLVLSIFILLSMKYGVFENLTQKILHVWDIFNNVYIAVIIFVVLVSIIYTLGGK